MNESVPRIISKLKERLREQQQKHKSLQQLKSSIEEVCVNPVYFYTANIVCFQLEKLTSQEIPVKTNELSSTNRELQSVENDLKKVSKYLPTRRICFNLCYVFNIAGDRMFSIQGEVTADTCSGAKSVTTIIPRSGFEETGATNSSGRG